MYPSFSLHNILLLVIYLQDVKSGTYSTTTKGVEPGTTCLPFSPPPAIFPSPEFRTHLTCQSLRPPLIKSFKITASLAEFTVQKPLLAARSRWLKNQKHVNFTITEFWKVQINSRFQKCSYLLGCKEYIKTVVQKLKYTSVLHLRAFS